ncbi:HNH endonuclease signature motif containing protein [Microbacterium sp. NIBRBAC000506063]|uniref:HNH endonuclease signature motif containing protein n=1 Tax=Microbacterium sp. NIBRBAC000506063 TaxID=2734618 RepID=UPI001BB55D11|nr:HNH endonuclease signature motif containing protein [Microbacterium sp. NIBRBAC000506063]QTV79825.1 DUF222 domain-containing protein [Microbacterium sp. NIBRBAC000506063]
MAIITELHEQLTAVAAVLGDDVTTTTLAQAIESFDDEQVLALLSSSDALARGAERLRIAAAGSWRPDRRETRAHRARPVARAQHAPLAPAGDDGRDPRRGAKAASDRGGDARGAGPDRRHALRRHLLRGCRRTGRGRRRAPWHAPLSDALLHGTLTAAQHDAILRGLGEPPVVRDPEAPDATEADAAEAARVCREAWSLAAIELIAEAPDLKVEALGKLARTVRDRLDPEGAERRFDPRFEARSFQMWTDGDGIHHGHLVFDDHGAAWVRSIIDATLRPRRGGPRFVDPEEKERADELAEDPRTNKQLSYDLILDVLRAGSLAETEKVFGARQPGVRLVQVVDAESTTAGPAHTEDGLHALPGWIAEQHRCESGTLPCRLDAFGNPLDVGREHRLFTPRQRIALALRDGGCRWRGCDRPASYCEAHHIDPYSEGGRTDIDRGILLCRYHHMALHNGGWRITREGRASSCCIRPAAGSPYRSDLPRPHLRLGRDRSTSAKILLGGVGVESTFLTDAQIPRVGRCGPHHSEPSGRADSRCVQGTPGPREGVNLARHHAGGVSDPGCRV